MPPSQLTALKSSLRDQGITGPQKSKKQRKQPSTRQNPKHRQAALQQIRDSFNPFDLRHVSARPAKFESVSFHNHNHKAMGKYASALYRPGVAKSAGEEMRRRRLLPEMRRRNKSGGLLDRRIGEGDAGTTAEERAVRRFAMGSGGGVFDLEGSEGEDGVGMVGLTHGGRLIDELEDDEVGGGGSGSGSEGGGEDGFMRRKRQRSEDEEEDGEEVDEGEGQPNFKKTKKEVMQEVIAKSKFHKYERQKAKEDDKDLREKLDAGMADLLPLLRGHPPPPKQPEKQTDAVANDDGPKIDPERQKLLDGMDRAQADRDYEKRLRELARDTRAKPAERTKTGEERAKEEAERLREMEDRRVKRMRGEAVSDDEQEEERAVVAEDAVPNGADSFGNDEMLIEAADFGFASAVAKLHADESRKIKHEDEDEFAFDDKLVASGSDAELSDESEADDDSDAEGGAPANPEQDEEDEFVKGILGGANTTPISALGTRNATGTTTTTMTGAGLPYTYPCPRTHPELLALTKDIPPENLPMIIQRIRALHHPSLSASNKDAMADFSRVLVEHSAYMAENSQSLPVVEQVIRHMHSLSRTYAIPIAEAFRRHLRDWHERSGGQPSKGDLVVLVAVGSIYPTSDHFHQVVTPAVTLVGRWLGFNAGGTMDGERRGVGAFMVGLCVNYQKLSKRYLPEAVRFTLRALSAGLGERVATQSEGMMGSTAGHDTVGRCKESVLRTGDEAAHLANLVVMADLWKDKLAFPEIFKPFLPVLQKLGAGKEFQLLQILLEQARQNQKPLELHHHRKQPIRSSNPKFEDGFNPDKHYDPDKERSEARKLRMEVKKEKKGAVRELRKDANFMARESLKDKRERDSEYEKKQRKLIAEIQGEEGKEAKDYARVKARRTKGGK